MTGGGAACGGFRPPNMPTCIDVPMKCVPWPNSDDGVSRRVAPNGLPFWLRNLRRPVVRAIRFEAAESARTAAVARVLNEGQARRLRRRPNRKLRHSAMAGNQGGGDPAVARTPRRANLGR